MSVGSKVAKTTAVLVLASTAVSGFYFDALARMFDSITVKNIDDQLKNRPEKPQGATAGDPINILVMGTDTRKGQGNGFGSSGCGGYGCSDTTILVHLSGDRQWATAVSIARDTYLALPDCILEDGSTSRGYSATFNTAHARGGPACVVTAVEKVTGIYVDRYVEVNFKGFKNVVDSVGGVDVCLTSPVNDVKSHLVLKAGISTLDGKTALAFVRARKTLGDGSDISRIRRQQDFLASLAKKTISAQTLLNPTRLVEVLQAVGKSLTTNIASADEMKQLALNLTDLKLSNIRFITAPHEPYPADPNRVQFSAKATDLWKSLRTDVRWPAPPDTGWDGKELTKNPDQITVRVLNGTKKSGLATKKASKLLALGYNVEKIANANTAKFAANVTAVYADKNKAGAARTIAKALGLSKVETLPKGTDFPLVVVVGKDFKDPVTVKVKPETSTSLYGPEDGRAADETSCSPV